MWLFSVWIWLKFHIPSWLVETFYQISGCPRFILDFQLVATYYNYSSLAICWTVFRFTSSWRHFLSYVFSLMSHNTWSLTMSDSVSDSVSDSDPPPLGKRTEHLTFAEGESVNFRTQSLSCLIQLMHFEISAAFHPQIVCSVLAVERCISVLLTCGYACVFWASQAAVNEGSSNKM